MDENERGNLSGLAGANPGSGSPDKKIGEGQTRQPTKNIKPGNAFDVDTHSNNGGDDNRTADKSNTIGSGYSNTKKYRVMLNKRIVYYGWIAVAFVFVIYIVVK